MTKKNKINSTPSKIIKEIDNQIKTGLDIKKFNKRIHEILIKFINEELK